MKRWRWALAAVASTMLLIAAVLLAASPSFRTTTVGWLAATVLTRGSIDSAELDRAPFHGRTIWLLVGTDDRTGLAGRMPHIGSAEGSRADAIALVALDGGNPPNARVLRLPRELLVDTAMHGRQRLGALLDHGAAALVDGVRAGTGIPIHHYVELDMEALVEVVDALGGLELHVERPARDSRSGLGVAAGLNRLNGEAALAYARSRTYEEYVDSGWRIAASGDLARIGRQQQLIVALAERLEQAGPNELVEAVVAAAPHIAVDRSASRHDLARLVGAIRDGAWSSAVLSVRPAVTDVEALSPFPPAHRGTFPGVVVDPAAADEQLVTLVGRTYSSAEGRS